jgi:hypothetical protein
MYENFKPFDTQIGSIHTEETVEGKRLGKAPARSHLLQLNLSDYLKKDVAVPKVYNYWAKRKPFQPYDVGNNEYGCCTIASQVLLAQRMERIEQNRTIVIPKDNILKTYFDLTKRLYGGGDTGAYELDALNNWRNPDLTFRDDKKRPYTIDAFVRVNQANIDELKKALFLAGAHGMKLCFNLPWAWSQTLVWDLPEGQQLIGDYLPGGWGGHSTSCISRWDENWLWFPSSWKTVDIKVSWKAIAAYSDECYLPVDSVNAWKKKPAAKIIDLKKLVSDVNMVSSQKIKAA